MKMRKGLNGVTFTGADDDTPIEGIIEIAQQFPFIEVGILVSATREGEPRYPSRDWQRRFRNAALDADINVAMHVCGQYSREFFNAERSPWERIGAVKHCARRIQVNGGPSHCSMHLQSHLREILRRERVKEFIFQIPRGHDALLACFYDGLPAFGLFDESGGRGHTPRERSVPVAGSTIACNGKRYVGYAGGIGLSNLHKELDKIEYACPDEDFWIDMEGRIRDEETDRLILSTVHAIAGECARRMAHGATNIPVAPPEHP